MKICGIFSIKNKINNKIYIGQSEDCYKRWLKIKTESNTQYTPLHNDILQYGENNFIFEIIEKTPAYLLNSKKKYYIQKYNTIYPNGYNLDKGGNYYSSDNYIINDKQ